MTSRRKFLAILGGGVVLAAGGATAFLTTRTPTKALAPWGMAGDYAEPQMRALSYAILAPNPHNRQPWIVDLSTDGEIAIWRDKAKDLPHTDPYERQLTIGMGCFIEQLAVAASATGHKVDYDLFPEGEDGPVAVARFSDGAAPDPLFDHVLTRRSCKEAYEDRPVAAVPALEALADIHTDPAKVNEIREMTREAFRIEMFTHRTLKESIDLFRVGKAEINANPDGIDLGGPFFESLKLAGLITHEAMLDTENPAFTQNLAGYDEMLLATHAYAVVRTPGNSRLDQIAAGRRWLRLNLTTTSLGLSLHPVSQALQEYPEMAEQYALAQETLAGPGETVQMLGRLGHGPEVPPSPRWPVEAKLKDG